MPFDPNAHVKAKRDKRSVEGRIGSPSPLKAIPLKICPDCNRPEPTHAVNCGKYLLSVSAACSDVANKLEAIREASGDGWAGVDVDQEIAEMRGSHVPPSPFSAEDALIEKHIISIISHPEEAVSLAYSLGALIEQRNRRADARILELQQKLCDA